MLLFSTITSAIDPKVRYRNYPLYKILGRGLHIEIKLHITHHEKRDSFLERKMSQAGLLLFCPFWVRETNSVCRVTYQKPETINRVGLSF